MIDMIDGYSMRVCHSPLSLCLVFYGLVLADGFTVFHGHLGLVGTHLFALPKIVEKKPRETSGNLILTSIYNSIYT